MVLIGRLERFTRCYRVFPHGSWDVRIRREHHCFEQGGIGKLGVVLC